MKRYVLLFLAASLTLFGCTLAEVKVNVVSERTALENQVLGSYNALSRDVLLVASVRGVDSLGRIEPPPRRSREQQDVIEAMETLAFHEDDVEAFKRLGWAGENREGLLTAFSLDKSRVPDDLTEFAARYREEEFKSVLKAVNEARESVMGRVVEINASLTAEDLPEIRKVFGKINRENALPGESVQNEDGSWTKKP